MHGTSTVVVPHVPILESLSLRHPLYRVLYCTTAIALMKVEIWESDVRKRLLGKQESRWTKIANSSIGCLN